MAKITVQLAVKQALKKDHVVVRERNHFRQQGKARFVKTGEQWAEIGPEVVLIFADELPSSRLPPEYLDLVVVPVLQMIDTTIRTPKGYPGSEIQLDEHELWRGDYVMWRDKLEMVMQGGPTAIIQA